MFFHNKNKINLKKDSLSEAIEKKTSNKKISDKTLAKILKKTILLLEAIENPSSNSLTFNNSSLELMALEISQHIRNITTSSIPLEINVHNPVGPGSIALQTWLSDAVSHHMRTATSMTMLKVLIILHYISNELNKSISLLDNPINRSPEPKFVLLTETFRNVFSYVNEKINIQNERYLIYIRISSLRPHPRYNLPEIVIAAKNALHEKLTSLTREAFRVSDIKLIARNLEEYEAFPSEINTYIDRITHLTRTVMTQTPAVTPQTRTGTPQTIPLSHRSRNILDKIQDEMAILEERKNRSGLKISEGGIQPGGRLIVYKINDDFLTAEECKEKNIPVHDGITLKYINDGEYLAACNRLGHQYQSCV